MSLANSQDRTSNGVESFHAALRRRVRSFLSLPNLFIFPKHLGEVCQDTVGDCDRLTRGCQILRSNKDNRAERQDAYQNLRRQICIGHVHSVRSCCLRSDMRGQNSSMTSTAVMIISQKLRTYATEHVKRCASDQCVGSNFSCY